MSRAPRAEARTTTTYPYRDPTLDVETRVTDLLARMTLEEKVGQMFQDVVEVGAEGQLVENGALVMAESTTQLVTQRHLTHFNLLQLPDAQIGAAWHNRMQRLAASTRLGIPVTISSDPRHSNSENIATNLQAGSFSVWPEAIGLAALQDLDAVRQFAGIACEEYRAIGIRSALHPQVDLATEPRWARQSTTFGPDAALSAEYVRAYLEGFQGTSALGDTAVACTTKHFPGGGPQKDGEDPHFAYGREQVYPTGNLEYHLEPFRAAVAAGTSAIMPYYGMPVGLTWRGQAIEEVGFGFNRQIIDGILRQELQYDGVVCTDWQLVSDVYILGRHLPPRAWGVEMLDRHARVQKILEAGCDQLGGEYCTDVLLDLVQTGRITETRIDESVRRLLRVKFQLGLFENPYVDESAVASTVGRPAAIAAGLAAQVRSAVLLQRGAAIEALHADGARAYVEGLDPETLAPSVAVVPRPDEATVAVLRLGSPFEFRDTVPIESAFHAGSLAFEQTVLDHVAAIAAHCPVAVEVTLDRPAVLTGLLQVADTVLGTFVVSDEAVARALLEPDQARGRLPFDLPRDMASVEQSAPDAPFDLTDPLIAHTPWTGTASSRQDS